jgi:hypothetical protein
MITHAALGRRNGKCAFDCVRELPVDSRVRELFPRQFAEISLELAVAGFLGPSVAVFAPITYTSGRFVASVAACDVTLVQRRLEWPIAALKLMRL